MTLASKGLCATVTPQGNFFSCNAYTRFVCDFSVFRPRRSAAVPEDGGLPLHHRAEVGINQYVDATNTCQAL